MSTFKTGDKVMLHHKGGWVLRVSGPFEVERETATQLVVRGTKFRKSDNQEFAKSYGSYTDELIAVEDPLVRRAAHEAGIRNAWGSVNKAWESLKTYHGKEDLALIEALQDRLEEYRYTLSEELDNQA